MANFEEEKKKKDIELQISREHRYEVKNQKRILRTIHTYSSYTVHAEPDWQAIIRFIFVF